MSKAPSPHSWRRLSRHRDWIRLSRLTTETADKHELYQLAVQDTKWEARFLSDTCRELTGRVPLRLCEDFCGTAMLCADWVKLAPAGKRTATGIDLDPSVLAWGTEHNLEPLGEARKRIQLVCADVRSPRSGTFDLVVALNFSYWIFRTRDALRRYFKVVRESLAEGGVYFVDLYGGWESQQPNIDTKDLPGGIIYQWEQSKFDPIDHSVVNYIHFELPNGDMLKKAFTYKWRYWSLPEVREVLEEAGFSSVLTYFCEDDDYLRSRKAENQPAWLSYLVALR